MEIEENEFYEKNESKYYCDICDFKCSYISDWTRHLSTRKHLVSKDGNKMEINGNKLGEKNENNYYHSCDTCKKLYKTMSGLWKHKKKCFYEEKIDSQKNENIENSENNDINDKELIVMLIKQNSELMKETSDFKSMMMEVIKNGTHNTTTTHTNSHNKAFNLNFFLNETCKDAMNIMDFVDSIKLQLSDLEKVGEIGYVEGISNIIVKNLKDLDVNKRPVHCTDKKRETMYIKDDNKWEKDEEKLKLHKVVRKVACKNQNLIPKFKEKHPDCGKYNSKFSDQYNKIVVESMGGPGDNEYEKEEKIIRNISKEITIDKEL
jgi:hypothetical protein